MCMFKPPKPASAPIVADPQNKEGQRMAEQETRLRRRRSAASSVLTGPRGIPASKQLGAPQ